MEFEISLFADLTIPYVPYYAYQETIIDLDEIKGSDADLVKAYERLTSTLMQLVPKTNDLYPEALKLGTKLLDKNHPFQIRSLEKLAELYQSQGLYSKAEPLYLEVLDRKKKSMGDNHPEVVISLHNLAELYESQKRYPEAESLYLEAKRITNRLSQGNQKTGWEEVTS